MSGRSSSVKFGTSAFPGRLIIFADPKSVIRMCICALMDILWFHVSRIMTCNCHCRNTSIKIYWWIIPILWRCFKTSMLSSVWNLVNSALTSWMYVRISPFLTYVITKSEKTGQYVDKYCVSGMPGHDWLILQNYFRINQNHFPRLKSSLTRFWTKCKKKNKETTQSTPPQISVMAQVEEYYVSP